MDFYFTMHEQIMNADRIPVVICALILTVVVGMVTGPRCGNANPFVWWGLDQLCGRFGDRLNKKSRGHGDLVFRGFLFCVFLLLFAMIAGRYGVFGFYLEAVALSLLITSGSIWFILLRLFFAMGEDKGIKGAYYGLSRSSRVDLNSVDDYGIVRTAMGYSAIAFDKGLVSPCIWYLIGGLPMVLIYTVLSFMAWRFGRSGHGSGFSYVPMALEKLMGFIPSLFSGALLTAAAAVTPTAKISNAFLSWWKAKDSAPYEQGGIVISAMAWPLDVSLGGPVRDISGASLPNNWVGAKDSTAQIDRHHLKRAIFMNVIAHLLFVLALLSAYVYAGRMV